MANNFLKKFFLNKVLLSLTVIIFFIFPYNTRAANLSIVPSPANVSVGDIVSVQVVVNTESKYINNGEAIIQFPTDMLEVVSVTKSSSIFSLWVEEPAFSNNSGQITFNGGVADPGFNGNNGSVISVTFRAKKEGNASIIFSDAVIRANDGLGTNILTSQKTGIVQIGKVKESEIPKTTEVVKAEKNEFPAKPSISSLTNPDQNSWYQSSTVSLNWNIPDGVTSIRTLLDKKQNSIPTSSYDNSVSQKTLKNLNNGIYYFHLRYVNRAGAGPVASYKIQIDSNPPQAFSPTVRLVEGQGLIKLNAIDTISGIDYYVLKIDDNLTFNIKTDQLVNNEYTLPVLSEGNHNISIFTYDKAGNKTESNLIFTSPVITSPMISLSSAEIIAGETVNILGKSDYPNKQVEVVLSSNGKEIKRYEQKISSDGSFSITTDEIKSKGVVSISAENIFSENVKSLPSEKIYLKINETETTKINLAILYPILRIIGVVVLLIILIIFIYMGWHKFFGLRKKVRNELDETARNVHKSMLMLREELNSQLESLEKIKKDRELNKKEEAIFKEIEENLDTIDTFIEKKLKKLI